MTSIVAKARCKHCEHDAEQLVDDFSNIRWVHTETGEKYCPTSQVAEPIAGEIHAP